MQGEGSLPMSVHQRQWSFLRRGWGVAYRLPWVDPWLSRSSLAVDANAHRDALSAPVATMLAGLARLCHEYVAVLALCASAPTNLRGRDAGPTPRFRAVNTAESYLRGRSAPSLTASRVTTNGDEQNRAVALQRPADGCDTSGWGLSRSRPSSEADRTEKARHAIPRARQGSSQSWVSSYIPTSSGKKQMGCCSQTGLVPFALPRLR